MGARSSKARRGDVETVNVHKLFDSDLCALRHREGHDGKGSDETAQHYHKNPRKYPLCEISDRTMQHAKKRFAEHVIVYSYADGLKQYPDDLVDSVPDNSDIWDRCASMTLLSIQEQVQQLDYFCRWKSLLEFLHKHDSALREDVLMQGVYPKITDILGYDPRVTDRKSRKVKRKRK
jgi:hypothetical protein